MSKPAEQIQLFEAAQSVVETYTDLSDLGLVRREVRRRDGSLTASTVARRAPRGRDAAELFDASWLSLAEKPAVDRAQGEIRIVDLFSGCGSMSLGVVEACRALNLRCRPLLAVDINRTALEVFGINFPDARLVSDPVETLLPGDPGEPAHRSEELLKDNLGPVDLLIGGPPCQGHSDLNNHTRRDDPKNRLYLRMARFAEIARPRSILIENVPGAVHDRSGIVSRTIETLLKIGYHVSSGTVRAEGVGVPQRRKRFFTVASLDHKIDLDQIPMMYGRPERPLSWAVGDLLAKPELGIFDSAATHSATNQARINYLFANDLYELPDSERPDCHRLKAHSYKAVYGRLRWDRPTPTITTGFGSTGQGRFVHPRLPRTLTPHEAARVQFIPDFFRFGNAKRVALQDMIGNAVPPKISYLLALELLR